MLRFMTLLTALTVSAGGWAVVTVEEVPDQVIVGRPVTFDFSVRQHGRTLLDGLRPTVVAEAGGRAVTAAGSPTGTGHYRATLTLPNPGQWTVTINSGFGNSKVTLLPVPAVNDGRPALTLTDAERGRRLFVAKGCLTCHVLGGIPGSGVVSVGPELTGKQFPAEFLTRFLADPAIAAPAGSRTIQMPNLELKPPEIAALVAFINGSSTARTE